MFCLFFVLMGESRSTSSFLFVFAPLANLVFPQNWMAFWVRSLADLMGLFYCRFCLYTFAREGEKGEEIAGESGLFLLRRILVSKFNMKQKKSLLGINDV